MEFLSTIYYHLRYNHPVVYFSSLLIALAILVANIISITASAGLLEAVGAKALSTRVVAAKDGLFWSYRAWSSRNADAEIVPKRLYGYFQSANKDGTVTLQVVAHDGYEPMRVVLADLQVTNPNGLAAIVSMHVQDPVDIDLYAVPGAVPGLPHAVLWLDGKPFNIDLIAASVAVPDKNPPTNIVDRAFAAYSWKIALGQ